MSPGSFGDHDCACPLGAPDPVAAADVDLWTRLGKVDSRTKDLGQYGAAGTEAGVEDVAHLWGGHIDLARACFAQLLVLRSIDYRRVQLLHRPDGLERRPVRGTG